MKLHSRRLFFSLPVLHQYAFRQDWQAEQGRNLASMKHD